MIIEIRLYKSILREVFSFFYPQKSTNFHGFRKILLEISK